MLYLIPEMEVQPLPRCPRPGSELVKAVSVGHRVEDRPSLCGLRSGRGGCLRVSLCMSILPDTETRIWS